VWALQPHHSLYAIADGAIRILPAQGKERHIVPQNLVELRVVATRPLGENGLGMNTDEGAAELGRIKPCLQASPRMTQGSWPPRRYMFDRIFARYAGIEIVHPADIAAGTR